jgi:histidine triad (HIT) family protein
MVQGKICPDIVWQSDELLAFRDIHPVAPTHILIVPKKHISTLNDLDEGDAALVGKMVLAAREIAAQEGLADEGYRLVFNCHEHGGQTVFHIHVHLLGGRRMTWPPG